MGYHTDFSGSFQITPTLTEDHKDYLIAFSETRRVKLQASFKGYDEARMKVDLPIGEEGAYFVGVSKDVIIDYNNPPKGQPGLWCDWTPNGEGDAIEWNGAEKFYNYVEWLNYLIEHFLKPWGYSLSGEVQWQGASKEDSGVIFCLENELVVKKNE